MYAIVDIETTGSHAAANGITEIAIYIHDGSIVVDRFNTLINPFQNIPNYITALTGISNEMVAAAPGFEAVAEKIFELLQGKVFVAHSVNFDYSFVKHQLKVCGFELNTQRLCTVRMSRKAFPGKRSYSLGNICRELDIANYSRHRADGDARATTELFEKILENGGMDIISQMLKRNSAEQWMPLQIDKSVIEKLPAEPGVYYFYDAKKKVIYIGKAINIRKRVAGHFMPNNGEYRRQQFLRQVADISYKVCASELHALVLESTEIKKLWPKYNYAQKKFSRKYGLYCFEDGKGFLRLGIDVRKKNLPSLYNFNLLYEGRVLLRKMSEEFGLHEKLCFLSKEPLSDDDFKNLGKPKKYNDRVTKALNTLSEKLPSFAIVDKGINGNNVLCMLIEKGNFFGMGYLSQSPVDLSLQELKNLLEPSADNDFIRNSLYKYAEIYPEKKIVFA